MARKRPNRKKPKYLKDAEIAARPEPQQRGLPADISKHAPHNSYGGVPLFYVDRPFVCCDCGAEEVWTAADQKWWYETAKGLIYSCAVRCLACRKKRQEEHGGNPRRSHRDRREKPVDPES